MNLQIHEDNQVGLVMNSEIAFEQKVNVDGAIYWKATQPIGSLFGSSVEGECQGIGRTKEQAVERLVADITHLSESMWA